jgi:hypothetical protein
MPAAGAGRLARVIELSYPGVVVTVPGASSTLRRVEVSAARWVLPRGLNIGVPRGRVEDTLGAPQLARDVSALYLYSDGYPDTVEFFLRDDRVHRIEWVYAPAE